MKNTILSLVVIASLAGCVVAPYHPGVYTPPVVYVPPAEPMIAYPQVETEYFWDPLALTFFFVYGGHRNYMPRGWGYRTHGVPHGYYHRH